VTCAMARNWTDGLSKVMRCSAIEAAVGQHTQPELDSLWLWNLKPMQFIEQCGQTSLLRRLAGQQHLGLIGVGAVIKTSAAPAITELQESSLLITSDWSML